MCGSDVGGVCVPFTRVVSLSLSMWWSVSGCTTCGRWGRGWGRGHSGVRENDKRGNLRWFQNLPASKQPIFVCGHGGKSPVWPDCSAKLRAEGVFPLQSNTSYFLRGLPECVSMQRKLFFFVRGLFGRHPVHRDLPLLPGPPRARHRGGRRGRRGRW